MSETKPKQIDVLRTPKPKKKLGLSVPPALRLPHDDLIIPLADSVPQNPSDASDETTMPSQTSLTRHTNQEDNPISPTRDSPKSQTL
jgi:hypothetical protein